MNQTRYVIINSKDVDAFGPHDFLLPTYCSTRLYFKVQ